MTAWRLVGIGAAIRLPLVAAYSDEDPPFRKESMPEWMLLRKVQPAYPAEAVRSRIQGTVIFSAVIGKDGRIERLQLVSGHPLFVSPARDAARQWLYRPTRLRGKPVRVITEIAVPFRLDANGHPVREEWRPQPKPKKPPPETNPRQRVGFPTRILERKQGRIRRAVRSRVGDYVGRTDIMAHLLSATGLSRPAQLVCIRRWRRTVSHVPE